MFEKNLMHKIETVPALYLQRFDTVSLSFIATSLLETQIGCFLLALICVRGNPALQHILSYIIAVHERR